MSVSTSRGSEPANTHMRAPLARYSSLSTNSSTSCWETFGPRSLISVCSPFVGSITAVLVRDSSRMRTKSVSTDSCVSCSTMRVPVAPPASPVAITGVAERLEHARDVDALAARHRRLLDGAVAAPEPEVRHRQRLVDGRVERDGDDHAAPAFSRARLRRGPRGRCAAGPAAPYRSTRRRRAATPIGVVNQDLVRCARPAAGTAALATSGTVAILRRPAARRPRRAAGRGGSGPRPGSGSVSAGSSRARARGRADDGPLAVAGRPRARARRRAGSGSARSTSTLSPAGAAVMRWKRPMP